MTARATAQVRVHDSTLNQLFFGAAPLLFGGDALFFGAPPPPGLTGGPLSVPVVIVADVSGKVLA